MKTGKKILLFWIIAILVIGNALITTSVASTTINTVDLYSKGDCGRLLMKDNFIVKTALVVYQKKGKEYPAYCLDKYKVGVGDTPDYSVNVDEVLTDVNIWKILIYGYPYQTVEQLGCANEKEAFVATKMAVYSLIYGYHMEEFTPIGEAGMRTWNAIKQILDAANSSQETKITAAVEVVQETEDWKIDTNNKEYITKVFRVESKAPMNSYQINIENGEIEGLLLTDMEGNRKEEYTAKERFKISIPIRRLGSGGMIRMKASGKVNTKPILIGRATDSSKQDYALTGGSYEEGIGEKQIIYSKNETKIRIIKKEKNTDICLPGARFDLLNDKKEKIKQDLVTNEKGEILIENILPGKYYLIETKAPEGYEKFEKEIELTVGFNEELSVIVKDEKSKIPEIEIGKKQIEKTEETRTQTKLPKTGM